jgi:hypothetical protein
VAVFGVASATSPVIGDPWYESATASVAVSASFDGHFPATVAKTSSATPGTTYYWGTYQIGAAPPAGTAGAVQWTQESMVFPISFR